MGGGGLGKPRLEGLIQDGLPGALPAPLSLVPTIQALLSAASPCAFLPPLPHLGHAPNSALSPVPKLPIQVQTPLPKDSDSSSDSDYEHYDFSAQPPVALTTFYSECLGLGSPGGPPAPTRERAQLAGTISGLHLITPALSPGLTEAFKALCDLRDSSVSPASFFPTFVSGHGGLKTHPLTFTQRWLCLC